MLRRPLSLVAVALAHLACSATRTPSTAPPAPPPVVSVVDASASVEVAPAPDAAFAAPDATSDDAGDAPRDPREALVSALAAGTSPLAGAVDPARGVTVIRYVEASPNGRGRETISSTHLCGAALTRALPSLRRDLVEAVRQSEDMEGLGCEGDRCVVRGMEYQPSYHLFFATVGGAPRLEAIAHVSEAALSDEWLERAHAYVDRSLAAARARPCAAAPR